MEALDQRVNELKRLKNRKKTNCDGVNCMFNRESGRNYNTPIMCDHLEAQMMTMSREQVRELLTQLLPN